MGADEIDGSIAKDLEAANSGDREAAARILSTYLPYWMGAARGIVSNSRGSDTDPADLVQDAIAKLLVLWRAGDGPTSNVRAYVSTMMRNAFTSRMRSPRSRERSFDEMDETSSFVSFDDHRDVEIGRETDALRRALDRVSPLHRRVLMAVTVEGRKPAELVEAFERSAPAISNLLVRARHDLHRALLVEYLSGPQRGGEECAENAATLPKRVRDRYEDHAEDDRGLAHVRTCDDCRRNWRRFAAVASALGLLPLLTIVELTSDAAPATAAPEAEGNGEAAPDAYSEAAGSGSAPADRAGTVAAVGASGASRAGRALASKYTLVACGVTLVAAVGLLAVYFMPRLAGTGLPDQVPSEGRIESELDDASGEHLKGGAFDASLSLGADRTLRSITVRLTPPDERAWSAQSVRLTLPSGVELQSASNGLQCDAAGSGATCAASAASDLGAPFVFETAGGSDSGSFSLELVAVSGGDSITGHASGSW